MTNHLSWFYKFKPNAILKHSTVILNLQISKVFSNIIELLKLGDVVVMWHKIYSKDWYPLDFLDNALMMQTLLRKLKWSVPMECMAEATENLADELPDELQLLLD